ncbi:MAG: DMT family transporter [Bacillota bacterium]|nr:DMT family transporter [Bacillota bacterium]
MDKYLNRLPGTAAVLIATVFWSLSPAMVKAVNIDAMLLPCLRAVIAGLLLLPFFKPRQLRFDWRLLLMATAFSCISLFAVMAFRYTATANATALYFSSPLWVFIFTSIVARKIKLGGIPSVLLLALGIFIILLEPKSGSNQLGNIMGICAGVAFATFALSFDRVEHARRMNYLAACNLYAAPFIALVILISSPQLFAEVGGYDAGPWLMLLLMAVTQQIIPYYLYGIGLSKLPVFRVSMLGLGEFVLSPVWTLILLRDIPTWYGFCGWLLIFAGLVLNLYLSFREEHGVNNYSSQQQAAGEENVRETIGSYR